MRQHHPKQQEDQDLTDINQDLSACEQMGNEAGKQSFDWLPLTCWPVGAYDGPALRAPRVCPWQSDKESLVCYRRQIRTPASLADNESDRDKYTGCNNNKETCRYQTVSPA